MFDDVTVLEATTTDGAVMRERVPRSAAVLNLGYRQLVAVSGSIAPFSCLATLYLDGNAFANIPACVLTMTQLTFLDLSENCLVAIPREIYRLAALKWLELRSNQLTELPREVGRLAALDVLTLDDNELTSVPAELGQLSSLRELSLQRNLLEWLPLALDRLQAATKIFLGGNSLPIDVGWGDSRSKLPELFAATTWPSLDGIRERATDVLIGLADLELPALLSLEILDELLPNSIPMHKKWDLVVAVKHWHQRHGRKRR